MYFHSFHTDFGLRFVFFVRSSGTQVWFFSVAFHPSNELNIGLIITLIFLADIKHWTATKCYFNIPSFHRFVPFFETRISRQYITTIEYVVFQYSLNTITYLQMQLSESVLLPLNKLIIHMLVHWRKDVNMLKHASVNIWNLWFWKLEQLL